MEKHPDIYGIGKKQPKPPPRSKPIEVQPWEEKRDAFLGPNMPIKDRNVQEEIDAINAQFGMKNRA